MQDIKLRTHTDTHYISTHVLQCLKSNYYIQQSIMESTQTCLFKAAEWGKKAMYEHRSNVTSADWDYIQAI